MYSKWGISDPDEKIDKILLVGASSLIFDEECYTDSRQATLKTDLYPVLERVFVYVEYH